MIFYGCSGVYGKNLGGTAIESGDIKEERLLTWRDIGGEI